MEGDRKAHRVGQPKAEGGMGGDRKASQVGQPKGVWGATGKPPRVLTDA